MSVLSFDEIVLGMIAQGVPKERAEASARRELGIVHSPGHEVKPLDNDALEDAHVDEADKLVRALGGHVVRNSQKRASKVTPGVPDRMYFFPRSGKFAFWEAKKENGKQSTAQKYFQELCVACGITYLLGPMRALEQWLVDAGLAVRLEDGTYVITQPENQWASSATKPCSPTSSANGSAGIARSQSAS